jgi:ankyrin repeat protein
LAGYGEAIQIAARNGFEEILELLASRPSILDDHLGLSYISALQSARLNGHEGVVKLLLAVVKSASTNAEPNGDVLALQSFASVEDIESIEALLENGVDIDADGEPHGTALSAAVFYGHLQVVRFLLQRGADINKSRVVLTRINSNPLVIASLQGDVQMVKLLLANCAKVDKVMSYYKVGNFGTANQQERKEITIALRNQGMGVNAEDG